MKSTFNLILFVSLLNCIFQTHNCLAEVIQSTSGYVVLSEIGPNARTYYDLQSHGSSFLLADDNENPSLFHACYMISSTPGPGWLSRNVRYFYSTNFGESWDDLGNVTTTRSSFPVIETKNDGSAVFVMNGNYSGGDFRTQIFVDVAPGASTFTMLDPGMANGIPPLNPNVALHKNTNKLYFTASGFKNAIYDLSVPPGTFIGYTPIDTVNDPILSSIAVSNSGKIGIAYISDLSSTFADGSVLFIESTDNGYSWDQPEVVWEPDYQADSLAALRGISVIYKNENPFVAFEVCKRIPEGSYFPKSISKIMLWSPVTNSGTPVMVDSASGLTGTNPVNDVFVSVCRPVLAVSTDNYYLFVAYHKARSDTDSHGNNYFDVYSVCTYTDGQYWGTRMKITNNTGVLMDNRYVSISKRVHSNQNPLKFYLSFQSDSVPGSHVNGANPSLAKCMFAAVTPYSCGPIGIHTTNNHIPESFQLKQNYPNPFNPVTQIEFSVSASANVELNIFDVNGRLVAALLNSTISPGNYKVDFDGKELSSGVYYYILQYQETGSGIQNSISRKMVLIK